MTDLTCNFCNKHFKNLSNLTKHKNTAKFCLDIQNKNFECSFNCQYCEKEFIRKDHLSVHLSTCKDKEIITLTKTVKQLEKKLKEKENFLNTKEEENTDLKNKLEILKVKYEFTQSSLQEQNIKIKQLEEDKEKFKTSLENLASKAIENAGNKTINNNTTNKNRIVQNLIPLTDDYMREQKQFLTYQTVKNGIEGIAEFASNHTFKDRVFCSDVSRLNFIFKSENGEVVKDPEGVELTKKFIDINKEELIRLLEEYLNQILDKLYSEDTDEVEYKIYAKRREEIIATRLAIKKGNVAENTESYNAFKRNFLYALSGLVPR